MLHLLDLLSLLLDLLLLLLQLALSLLLRNLMVLHLIANQPSTQGPDATANCRASAGCPQCGPYYLTCAGIDKRHDASSLCTRCERLPGASSHRPRHYY